jgi:hypothetical protein
VRHHSQAPVLRLGRSRGEPLFLDSQVQE